MSCCNGYCVLALVTKRLNASIFDAVCKLGWCRVKSVSCLVVVLMMSAALTNVAARAADPVPGERFAVEATDLPAPYATPAVANPPRRIARPHGVTPRVPAGFDVTLFAEGFEHARWLATAPDGAVFLAESRAGQVTLLRDDDGDGRAEKRSVFAAGFNRPHGLAVHGGYLYVADLDRVWRLPYGAGSVRAVAPPEPVTAAGALGGTGGHWTRNLAFHPDGSRFYVAIGSRGNIAEEAAPRASVQEFSVDGAKARAFASGLRNPVGIAFYPGTDRLYVVVNERDGMGDGLVPDYLTGLRAGDFFGWPYAYIGGNPQPGYGALRPDLVRASRLPDLLFQAHSAPLGLVFYDGAQFPPEYRGDGFVALHGSWNASRATGYMVARVPFRDGAPVGHYEAFATGFRIGGGDQATVWGRPVGLAVDAGGGLLVAEDGAQSIWRITYGR